MPINIPPRRPQTPAPPPQGQQQGQQQRGVFTNVQNRLVNFLRGVYSAAQQQVSRITAPRPAFAPPPTRPSTSVFPVSQISKSAASLATAIAPSISRPKTAQPPPKEETKPTDIRKTGVETIKSVSEVFRPLTSVFEPIVSPLFKRPEISGMTMKPPERGRRTIEIPPGPMTLKPKGTKGTIESPPGPMTLKPQEGVRPLGELIQYHSPLFKDIESLMTVKQQEGETQRVSNVPFWAQVSFYRDPLGGSTPFFNYVIRPGDNLAKIAEMFRVPLEDILRINRDRTDAIKSIPGRPLGEIIIAGKEIRIPAGIKEISKPPLLGKQVSSVDEINQLARSRLEKPSQFLDDNSLIELIQDNFSDNLTRLENLYNQYTQLLDPNYFRNQYEKFSQELGIPDTLTQLRNIQEVMARTREDIMAEAAAVGGLVTESQVAEVLNFRQGILKQQYGNLVDLLHEKEALLDKLMDYTRWDRKSLEDMLERELKLEEFKLNYRLKVLGKEFEVMKYLQNKNNKRIEDFARMGVLHTASRDYLLRLLDPDDPLYSGLTADELNFYLRYSRMQASQKELNRQKTLTQLEKAKSQGKGKLDLSEIIKSYKK